MSRDDFTDHKASGFFKNWAQIAFFYFIGLSIFFATAFLIVSLRISFKGDVRVPILVGKTYLDEHNRLQESGFEVKLQKVHSMNYPYGYIISQSLSPGEVVTFGQKIVLLVNQSKNIVQTPRLIGSLESLASKILGNVHSGKRRFRLNSGVITRVPSKRPKGEILAQYPLPKTPVRPEYPVSYLVSAGVSRGFKKAALDPVLKEKGLNIEILKSAAYHLRIPLDIEPISVEDIDQEGMVLESKPPPNTLQNIQNTKSNTRTKLTKSGELSENQTGPIWKVKVGKYKDSFAEKSESDYPFRFIWRTPDEIEIPQGVYTISQKVVSQNIGAADQNGAASYSHFSYLYLKDGRRIPLFKTTKEEFFIWPRYYPNVEFKEINGSEDEKPQKEKSQVKEETLVKQQQEPIVIYQPEDIEP